MQYYKQRHCIFSLYNRCVMWWYYLRFRYLRTIVATINLMQTWSYLEVNLLTRLSIFTETIYGIAFEKVGYHLVFTTVAWHFCEGKNFIFDRWYKYLCSVCMELDEIRVVKYLQNIRWICAIFILVLVILGWIFQYIKKNLTLQSVGNIQSNSVFVTKRRKS